ncbi:MAG: hypothetical protein RKH07_13755 [Gammaproteobacteria bacterium]
MQQQINLYLPEFRVSKDPLTAPRMLQIVGGLIGVLVLVSAFNVFSRWQLTGELEQLRITLAEETARTDELGDELARRSQNTALVERLDRAEARLNASQQIRNYLSQTKLGNVDGFSEFFKDLARASSDGISLNAFSITRGGEGVRITGSVIDSATVPRYVGNIEQGRSPLRNMNFNSSISRGDVTSDFFSFTLSSTQ